MNVAVIEINCIRTHIDIVGFHPVTEHPASFFFYLQILEDSAVM